MKLKVNWKELARQRWAAIRPVLLGAIGGGIVGVAERPEHDDTSDMRSGNDGDDACGGAENVHARRIPDPRSVRPA